MRILDPACGSGSFLLGAYQCLLDWHVNWYVADGPAKWSKGKNATIRPADPTTGVRIPGPGAGDVGSRIPDPGSPAWALTTTERKRILLDHIHGVDIDYQAVEVTKLSLLLRCLEGETADSLKSQLVLFHERALPDLGRNIQCGNSLIGTDIIPTDGWREMTDDERRRINPFDYERAFPQVFRHGGFDAVIGNPPYGAFASDADAVYFRQGYQTVANSLDTFIMFVERAGSLLRSAGRVGMIIPSGWVSTPSSKPLREYFLANFKAESFVSLPFDVFEGAYIDAVIFTAAKHSTPAEQPYTLDLFVFPHRHRITSAADFELRKMQGDTSSWLNSHEREFLITLSTADAAILSKVRGQVAAVGDFVEVKRGIETYTLHRTPAGLSKPRYAFDGVLQRFVLLHGEKQYLEYAPDIEASKPWPFFSEKRILLRQVLSRKLRLQATLTAEPFLTNQSVQSLLARKENTVALEWLLGILNSKLLSWYFVNLNSAARRDDFPKIIIKQTRELPVPKPGDLRQQNTLVELVQTMLAQNEQESKANHPQEKEQLRRHIEATDRQIDQLVYQRYGLTDDEIRIVEEATAPQH